MNLYSVLKRPVLSEKSNQAREKLQKYTFIVDKKATKDDVKEAVEKIYSVNVVRVATAITRGKEKRRGMRMFLESSKKKAVVTLSEGQSLKIFEDQ